jgi:hypothetical protein
MMQTVPQPTNTSTAIFKSHMAVAMELQATGAQTLRALVVPHSKELNSVSCISQQFWKVFWG